MINIVYRDGLLFTSIELEYRGKRKIIDHIVIDTGAAETILSPDALGDIGLLAEPDDYIHRFYGVGGSLHNFFSKSVDSVQIGTARLETIKLDFGMIDPNGSINGLLDILVKLRATVDLKNFTLVLDDFG